MRAPWAQKNLRKSTAAAGSDFIRQRNVTLVDTKLTPKSLAYDCVPPDLKRTLRCRHEKHGRDPLEQLLWPLLGRNLADCLQPRQGLVKICKTEKPQKILWAGCGSKSADALQEKSDLQNRCVHWLDASQDALVLNPVEAPTTTFRWRHATFLSSSNLARKAREQTPAQSQPPTPLFEIGPAYLVFARSMGKTRNEAVQPEMAPIEKSIAGEIRCCLYERVVDAHAETPGANTEIARSAAATASRMVPRTIAGGQSEASNLQWRTLNLPEPEVTKIAPGTRLLPRPSFDLSFSRLCELRWACVGPAPVFNRRARKSLCDG